ncbi:MAG TPA: PQQ-dependent sugar dehydrogenase [Candidatus Binatia bacterium]|nr:PQQ-dependent sugar dehydrogenase [Candidatus Binatia bacterium]
MGLTRKFEAGLLAALIGTLVIHVSIAVAGDPASGFVDTGVASGLSSPTAIAFLPDGTMLIAEKGGALKRGNGGSGVTLTTIPVCANSEMGLLGIAVDPNYATNGFVYLYRTKPGTPSTCSSSGRVNEVVRVQLTGSPPTFVAGSLTVLLTGAQTDNGNHDGGVLRIGPDGKLYAGVGDTGLGDNQGGPGSSTNPYSQDLSHLEGKILRLNLDGTIPGDNPFASTAGARGEVFARGFRNPFRMAFDPSTGALWVADVGDLTIEEIDIVPAGANASWPYCEGTSPGGCAHAGDLPPIFTYPHSGASSLGTSITGGTFAGSLFGPFDGDYFFGDYTGSAVYRADVNGTRDDIAGSPVEVVSNAGGPVDFALGPDGALYYVAINVGEVRRLVPTGTPPTDVDNYMCYRATLAVGQPKLPLGTQVQLEDQFDASPQTFDVKKAISICNPAQRNGSPYVHQMAHQEGFSIKAAKGSAKFVQSDHTTVDAFDGRTLTLTGPSHLLVPSSKVDGTGGAPPFSDPSVDHYKCYKAKLAKGSAKFTPPVSPIVTDQFYASGQTFDVKRVTKLCTPVAADGSVVNLPASHLVCYQVRLPAGTRFTSRMVSTNNPDFGDDLLKVTAPSELCVPALKDP